MDTVIFPEENSVLLGKAIVYLRIIVNTPETLSLQSNDRFTCHSIPINGELVPITWVFRSFCEARVDVSEDQSPNQETLNRRPAPVLIEFERSTELQNKFDGQPWIRYMHAVAVTANEIYPERKIASSIREIEVREMINLA